LLLLLLAIAEAFLTPRFWFVSLFVSAALNNSSVIGIFTVHLTLARSAFVAVSAFGPGQRFRSFCCQPNWQSDIGRGFFLAATPNSAVDFGGHNLIVHHLVKCSSST